MTIVLSLLTQDRAIQVSDRRLSTATEIVDDDANKITLFVGRIALGYTGLAVLEGQRTDVWMTQILAGSSDHSVTTGLLRLREHLERVVYRTTGADRRAMRFSIVGVGWSIEEPGGPYKPIATWVSNFEFRIEDAPAPQASDSFECFLTRLDPDTRFRLIEHGHRLSDRTRTSVRRQLLRVLDHAGSAFDLVRVLVDAIRTEADSNRAIGKHLLAVSLPRVVMGSPLQGVVLAGSNNDDTSCFWYFREGDDSGVWHGPNLAVPGGAIWGTRAFGVSSDPQPRP